MNNGIGNLVRFVILWGSVGFVFGMLFQQGVF